MDTDQVQAFTIPTDIRSNPVLCPGCGKKSMVYKTKGNRRNRKCDNCGARYVTQEVHQGEVDRLLNMVNCALELERGIRDGYGISA